METRFITGLVIKDLMDGRYIQLYHPFIYYSKLLKREVHIPSRFICDLESVPVLKGSSNRGGVVHDYFCRTDSSPIVTKQQAADLYLEVQAHRDSLKTDKKFIRWFKRNFKTLIVRITPGYFHKYKVFTPLKDLKK